MKNSDFIKMTQCRIYSVTFPTENLVETLEKATFLETPQGNVEMVRNPMTRAVVQPINGGLFFSMRITYRAITEALLNAKVYELKQAPETLPGVPQTDSEWRLVAKALLLKCVPASSEIVNVFYSPDHQLLFCNKNSRCARLALHQLIELFGVAGFKTVVVSDEKLGLQTRFKDYLNENKPMFKHLHFENEATLLNVSENVQDFLLVGKLDQEKGREKALDAVSKGFEVQSMAMRTGGGNFSVFFKLDRRLNVRSMKFSREREMARALNGKELGKHLAFVEYLEDQFELLLAIAKSTVLEFTGETKLAQFI